MGSHIWHERLGHPSVKVVQFLNHLLKLDVVISPKDTPCSICPLAKQKRLPFISHHHIAAKTFDLIHCDAWGPYHIPTSNNQRYFFTLVDDCTRFTWAFIMQHKYEALHIVSRFCIMIEAQFSMKIKSFRTDNAKELAFTEFQNRGILHQFSCVQTPQQNSVVERKHQHLLNVARSLFFQSHVPIRFWSERVLTTTYLITMLLPLYPPLLLVKFPPVLHQEHPNNHLIYETITAIC